MNIIETQDLVKRYGSFYAVNQVNMHIPEGSIYGFVGENGSGKTTIMRLLTGLAEPTKGSFSLCGIPNRDKKIYVERKKMAAIVEVTSLIPSMTARENIIYQELNLGVKLKEEERKAILETVGLHDVGKRKVKNFSLGMRQRLGIALCLINHPKLLFLDEPMNGLDPQGIAELRELLIKLNKEENITILISSHILSELEKIATHYGFISHGKLIEELTVEELNAKGRKSLRFTCTDEKKALSILKDLKEVTSTPNGEITVYDDVPIGMVVMALEKADVHVLSIHSNEESVEEYYLSLVKKGE